MKHLTNRLDRIASALEDKGLTALAKDVDTASDFLDNYFRKVQEISGEPMGWDYKVTKAVISGGVHGNEIVGAMLAKELQELPNLVKKPGMDLSIILGNPEAVDRCVRFVDEDLNRCFSLEKLTSAPTTLEASRAQDLFRMLGGKKNSVDLVADFHSTSSKMGFTFIVSRLNPFVCRLVAWLYNKYQSPYFHIYYTPEDQDSSPFFDSLGKSGLTVEIGPIPHGTTPHADVYKSARQLAVDVMEFSVGWNDGIHTPEQMIEVPVYKKVQDVLHLKDASGALVTQVDPDRLGKDYQPINKGDSMLVQLGTGERIPYEGDRTAYPVFINETAKTYYGKAMQLAWLSMEKW